MKITKKYIKIIFSSILLLSVSFWLYFFKNDDITQEILNCTNYPSDISNVDSLVEYAYENKINIKGKYNTFYTIWCFEWIDSWSFEVVWNSMFARDKNSYYEFWYYWNWTNRLIVIKNKLNSIDRESIKILNSYTPWNENKKYWIFSDKNSVYFYKKDWNLEKLENIDPLTFEFIKRWNYDRTLSKIYFQDKNWLYFAHLSQKWIYYKKVLNNSILTSNTYYYSDVIIDTGKQIIREGKILDYIDYKTLVWIWNIEEYKKDKKNVYDKNFDIIPNLNPDKTVDLWYENKYYISDGNYFYLTWQRETENYFWYKYENVISINITPELISMYNQMKSFYENWAY